MDNEVEARKLTAGELKKQTHRLIEFNVNPKWDKKTRRSYYASIDLLGGSIFTHGRGKKADYRKYKEGLYKIFETINGEIKKDDLTIMEEEMERKYFGEPEKTKEQEEREREETRKKVEERERRWEEARRIEKEKEEERIKRIEENRETRKIIYESIANFFKKIIGMPKLIFQKIKRLITPKEKLSLNSGEIENNIKSNQRNEFVEQLREGVWKEQTLGTKEKDGIELKKEKKINRNQRNER